MFEIKVYDLVRIINIYGNFVIICDKVLDETKNPFEVTNNTNFSFPCIILLFIKSWLMFIITGYYFYRKTKNSKCLLL